VVTLAEARRCLIEAAESLAEVNEPENLDRRDERRREWETDLETAALVYAASLEESLPVPRR
jgi:hypothetical protein